MRLPFKIWHLPPRLATGAYILNSGLSKRRADQETASHVHGMAAATYPFLEKMDARFFTRVLAMGEIALGGALLFPVVPTALAGVGLTGFSAGLIGLYLRTPGMRQEGTLRPTQEGMGLAKDVWMLGLAFGFVLEALVDAADAATSKKR